MKIAIDAMGGDHAPLSVVEGALQAGVFCPAELVLVGDEEALRALLPDGISSGVRVVHAPLVVSMEEFGPTAIRKKREASINVAMRMLAEGEVDCVVSAGNSSAVVAAAKHFVGLLPGLKRPALAVSLPTTDARPILLDAGAHPESGALHLAQSALLAHMYLRVSRGIERPAVALLNIGSEATKGTRAVQRAYALLHRSSLNFLGNMEPHELFAGKADAVVCDGFVGNIVMKMCEGFSEWMMGELGSRVAPRSTGLGTALEDLKQGLAYQHVGGAPLLGVKSPVIVAHGRSGRSAVSSAIGLACRITRDRICEKMADIEQGASAVDFKQFSAMVFFENFKTRWSSAPK